MRYRGLTRPTAIASAAILVTLICGPGLGVASAAKAHAAAGKPVAGGTITVVGSPKTLDPGTTATQPSSAPWFTLVYGQLFRHNPNNSISPYMATSYVESPDGLTATIQLKKGITFQDGTPFNAAAVQFNLERDLKGDASGTCPCEPFINAISKVTTKGAYTVVLHLSHRDNLLYDALSESTAGYIISPTAYQKAGPLNYGLNPVGAGPYRVTAFTPSTSVTFVKYNHFFIKGHPYIQQINVENVLNDQPLLAGLGSQTLDWVTFNNGNLSSTVSQALTQYSSFTHEVVTGANLWMEMQFNAYKPPFNNIQAREAIAEATDPTPFVGGLAGYDKATCQIQGPSQQLPVGTACPAGYLSYNPTAAAALVTQLKAQYGSSYFNFSIEDITNTTVEANIDQALIKEYQAVGMNPTFNFVSHGQMVADQAVGNFNLFAPNPGGGDDNPLLSVAALISAGSPQNAFGYKSATLDALLVRAETAKSPAQEDALWKQFLDTDELQYANIPLLSGAADEFVNDNLHGVVFAGRDTYFDNAWWSGS
jgi:peptide/nickel transport system substrate-binding protein